MPVSLAEIPTDRTIHLSPRRARDRDEALREDPRERDLRRRRAVAHANLAQRVDDAQHFREVLA